MIPPVNIFKTNINVKKHGLHTDTSQDTAWAYVSCDGAKKQGRSN